MKMNYAPLIFTLFITAALTLHGDSYLGQVSIIEHFFDIGGKKHLVMFKSNNG